MMFCKKCNSKNVETRVIFISNFSSNKFIQNVTWKGAGLQPGPSLFDGEGIDLQQLCEELSYSDDEEIVDQAEVLGRAYENEEEIASTIPNNYKVVAINNEDISKLKTWIKIEFFDQQFEEN